MCGGEWRGGTDRDRARVRVASRSSCILWEGRRWLVRGWEEREQSVASTEFCVLWSDPWKLESRVVLRAEQRVSRDRW